MGAPAARLGSMGVGDKKKPIRPSMKGSSDVFIEGAPACSIGDDWVPHRHPAVSAAGSSSVFVNGKPLTRLGDELTCGSIVVSAASTVFAGG